MLRFLSILTTCIVASTVSVAESLHKQAKIEIEKSLNAQYNNPQQAIFFARKAIDILSEQSAPDDLKAEAIIAYGQGEKLLGNFDASIKILYDAAQYITTSNKHLEAQLDAITAMAYCSLTDYNKAIELNDKATATFKSLHDSVMLASCYNDRGIILCYREQYKLAEPFFRQSLEINRALGQIKKVAANLNNLCLYEGNTEEKLEFIREAITINKNINSQWSLGENYNNMGKQYYYAGRYTEALEALKKAFDVASTIGAKGLMCDNYEYMSMVYYAMSDYRNAYQYQSKLFDITKELRGGGMLRNVEQEIAMKRYAAQRREAETREKEYEIRLLKRNIISLLAAVVFIVAAILLRVKWYRHNKNMELMQAKYSLEQSVRELAELKIHQHQLEIQTVQNSLDNSRREALSFAVFLRSRNELLDKIRDMIKQGYRMDTSAMLPHLKQINAFIAQYQSVDKSNNVLMSNLEEKKFEFLQRLSLCHPNLTPGEKHLATLVCVNLSTKEISMLTGSTPKTINMNRYRLRKSLGLSPQEDLTDYLQNI